MLGALRLMFYAYAALGISCAADDTRAGWTVGGSLDCGITVEYRYSQYETKSFVYPIPILNLGLSDSSRS
jgi:hypothetical protein